MKPLPFNGWLYKNTKIKSVTLDSKLGMLDAHQSSDGYTTVYYITQHSDADKIYLICSEGLWDWIFREPREDNWNREAIMPLPISGCFDEDTRLDSIFFNSRPGIFELHSGRGDDEAIYVSKHGDPSKIYMVCTEEIWNWIFERE